MAAKTDMTSDEFEAFMRRVEVLLTKKIQDLAAAEAFSQIPDYCTLREQFLRIWFGGGPRANMMSVHSLRSALFPAPLNRKR